MVDKEGFEPSSPLRAAGSKPAVYTIPPLTDMLIWGAVRELNPYLRRHRAT